MKKKAILIAGSSGLIGRALSAHLSGHEIIGLGRSDFERPEEEFLKAYEHADVIINLSGAPIIKRWTEKNKREILESRLGTTRKLGRIVRQGKKKPRLYISASATGIYADSGIHNEYDYREGTGFVTEVVKQWEATAMDLSSTNTCVAILRIGIVLSPEGGIMKKILPVFRAGLGGRIGNGEQAFSWIHIRDLVRAVEFIIEREMKGVFNLVSPGHCRNKDFTRTLGRILRRPALIPIPVTALKILYGQGASVVAGGQAAEPGRLMKEDFRFSFPQLVTALEDVVN